MSGFIQPIARPEVASESRLLLPKEFAAHKRFYATIFVKRLFYTDETAGQRLHTDQNLPSVALSDSDC
jgi:hypothetical protein